MTDYERGVNQASAIYQEAIRDYVTENEKLKRRLEILKGHGIEIVDAVAGGFEIYNKEHARADRLQAENEKLESRLTIYMADAETWNAQWVAEHESNAKLRELCIDLAEHLLEAERIHGDNLLPDGYKRRMSELGIEVKQ